MNAVVSYRSVPRILELFKSKTTYSVGWVPHFTSVINWSLRLGLGLLTQVQAITKPWIAIIDHSIDIGTKKALVVLRVEVDALSKRGSAIRREDCECIGLTVSDKVTGDTLFPELEAIFSRAGKPVAIIKDRDATLNKGVRLWSDQQAQPVPTIDDIGHTIATALKAQFEKLDIYKRFTALVSHAAKCLRQTELAFLMPPLCAAKDVFKVLASWVNGLKKCCMSLLSKALPKKGANWLSYARHSLTSVNQETLLCGLHPRQKSFRRSWTFLKITDLIKPLISNALSSQKSYPETQK